MRRFVLASLPLLGCQAAEPAATTQVTTVERPDDSSSTFDPIMTSTTSQASSSTTDAAGDLGVGTTDNPFETDTSPPDFGAPGPVGCKGKIDLLFAINRDGYQEYAHPALTAALPGFLDLIKERFTDYDLQIMTVAGDIDVWGIPECEAQCTENAGQGCEPIGPADYPCHAYDGGLTECDFTFGAGSTFPAAFEASNERCQLTGGNRYITSDEVNLDEAFLCITSQGHVDASPIPASAMQMAVHPELVGPGGCNEGFVRDDALLVVVLISGNTGNSGQDGPEVWINALLAAKHGNPDAVVVLALLSDDKDVNCGGSGGETLFPLHVFAEEAPHGLWGSICAPDLVPFLDQAIGLVDEVCEVFIPE